jgi:hypothetical protein
LTFDRLSLGAALLRNFLEPSMCKFALSARCLVLAKALPLKPKELNSLPTQLARKARATGLLK